MKTISPDVLNRRLSIDTIKWFLVRMSKKMFRLLLLFRMVIRILRQHTCKTIYLFGSPNHSNLGDQAQTYCIELWCREHFPNYKLFVFQEFSRHEYIYLRILRYTIRQRDIIICHSGYHMTDLWPLYKIYLAVIKRFPDFPVTVFPQTINFTDKDNAKKIAEVFESHSDCTLLCRDSVSFTLAQDLFRKTKLILFPDIVTLLIGSRHYSHERDGVVFCMRNDKEAYYTREDIDSLRSRFVGVKTVLTDTTLSVSAKKIIANRAKVLETIFDDYAHFQVMITDRYHGVIFSIIAGTPVVVVKSADHKLSSGVDWFPKNLFAEYISFANDLNEAYQVAMKMLENPPMASIPPYFKTKYYDQLLDKLSTRVSVLSSR